MNSETKSMAPIKLFPAGLYRMRCSRVKRRLERVEDPFKGGLAEAFGATFLCGCGTRQY